MSDLCAYRAQMRAEAEAERKLKAVYLAQLQAVADAALTIAEYEDFKYSYGKLGAALDRALDDLRERNTRDRSTV